MLPKKISWGITGGIGSGKSYVCHHLEQRGIPVFYTDEEARKEMLTNTSLRQDLKLLLGTELLTPDGNLDKRVLSAYIRQSSEHADRVNALVHPCVRERLHQWIFSQSARVVAVECALLFESGFNKDVDYTLLVTAPTEIKVQRVMLRDGKTREEVLSWMSLQLSDDLKISLADYVLVNDGIRDLGSELESIIPPSQTAP